MDRVEISHNRRAAALPWEVLVHRGGDCWLMAAFYWRADALRFARALALSNGLQVRLPSAKVIDFGAARAAQEVVQ